MSLLNIYFYYYTTSYLASWVTKIKKERIWLD